MKKFFDTSSLLISPEALLEEKDEIYISSITLNELENIKTSSNKDSDIKYAARYLLRLMDSNAFKYNLVVFKEKMLKPILKADLSVTNDMKILACAISLKDKDLTFITNDLALKNIAKSFFVNVESNKEDFDDYVGFEEMILNNDELNYFYENKDFNHYNLKENQYLLIYDEDDNLVDRLCWTGKTHRRIVYETFKSNFFGPVKPKDVYQALAADSLIRNKITMIKGAPGSGKTYLSLGYLMSLLESGKIDKIIVFCNTVAAKNSAKLGFYPGTRDEKLLDSQIGNLLASKLGGKIAVEQMIAEERLVLLPFSDIRGYDTSGMNAGIYISEAQNLDIPLMKLALQRIGEDCVCIIDGDCKAQVDDISFAGSNNGMKRVSKIFRGHDVYGEVELQFIHRSKIANIAEDM